MGYYFERISSDMKWVGNVPNKENLLKETYENGNYLHIINDESKLNSPTSMIYDKNSNGFIYISCDLAVEALLKIQNYLLSTEDNSESKKEVLNIINAYSLFNINKGE